MNRREPWLGAIGAAQFLTRIPVHTPRAIDLSSTVPWFGVIGAALGVILGAIAAGGAHLVPMSVAAAMAVLIGVLITGAFHEDGLADTADAIAGGWTRAERIRILDDPLHGSYGVAALCGSILLRVVCIATLGPAAAFGGLIAAHALARSGAVIAMLVFAPATGVGLGADYVRTLRRAPALFGVGIAGGLSVVAVGWWAPLMFIGVAAGVLGVGFMARRALGGITGDVLGAIEQVGECLALVVLTGLASRSAIWWR